MSDITKKAEFLNSVRNAVANIFFYNEQVGSEEVERLITSGDLSLREVLETFQAEIIKKMPNSFRDELEMAYLFKPAPQWCFGAMPPPPLKALNDLPKSMGPKTDWKPPPGGAFPPPNWVYVPPKEESKSNE